RRPERGPVLKQGSLFERREENPPLRDALDFYRHPHGWSNRLVAGDSLLVMNSLLEKEGLGGKVQMIYIDPPYGIRYGSNFQPFVNRRDVKDGKDEDLTQEPEMIRAFRDTWELGVHSYLGYLRDRLLLARELLSESGSVFVQIGDENLHLVKSVLDEVFGIESALGLITVKKTSGASSELLAGVCDYLLWYAKSREHIKYHPLFLDKEIGGAGGGQYTYIEHVDGSRHRMRNPSVDMDVAPSGSRVLRLDNMTSQRPPGDFPVMLDGKTFKPGKGYWKTGEEGMQRLAHAKRLAAVGNTLSYVRYFDDFPVFPINNVWEDTVTSGFSEKKVFVVQTNPDIIGRCLLMTTDPGDLVFDPTCGSGTTAYVAEQWGRRWITCDTSRIAVTLAKQRLMTAVFDYYRLAHEQEGVGS
ncbi:MAG: site-specific DNA-methyltransferase, partial [bacterium]